MPITLKSSQLSDEEIKEAYESNLNTNAFTDSDQAKLASIVGSSEAPWDYYASNWTTAPAFNASVVGGDVYTYILDSTTRYRFVPVPYFAEQDAFYSTFDGMTLTNLIATRG